VCVREALIDCPCAVGLQGGGSRGICGYYCPVRRPRALCAQVHWCMRTQMHAFLALSRTRTRLPQVCGRVRASEFLRRAHARSRTRRTRREASADRGPLTQTHSAHPLTRSVHTIAHAHTLGVRGQRWPPCRHHIIFFSPSSETPRMESIAAGAGVMCMGGGRCRETAAGGGGAGHAGRGCWLR
jgi:hypothetical protein